ncbi:alpha-amylase family glycosyl hydrolase, partial [Salmonella enterica subsp. enterica serovar Infantis]
MYPTRRQDTTGRGTGEERGVTQHLDDPQRLGGDAIGLTPCYLSPQGDIGYDVGYYSAFDPTSGTLVEFEEL